MLGHLFDTIPDPVRATAIARTLNAWMGVQPVSTLREHVAGALPALQRLLTCVDDSVVVSLFRNTLALAQSVGGTDMDV